MANEEHLAILREGVGAWNEWRFATNEPRPVLTGAVLTGAYLSEVNLSGAELSWADLSRTDLSGAYLSGAALAGADLSGAVLNGAFLNGAYLSGAYLTGAKLSGAALIGATLSGAALIGAYLSGANLSGADLKGSTLVGAKLNGANLTEAHLERANLSGADLAGANLTKAHLVETIIEEASFSGAYVYGVAAWNLKGKPMSQIDLVVTPQGQPAVTVDDIEVAQFIYLMLHNGKLRRVINRITSKVVLILGRFTLERKQVLDALRGQLRNRNLTPVGINLDVPDDRDIAEAVTLLARMARFIVADLTDPSSIPMELEAIAPNMPVPIRAIVHKDQEPFSMFRTLEKYHWVLPPHEYGELDELLNNLDAAVIAPAEAKRKELTGEDPT